MSKSDKAIRVLIADDSPTTRRGIRSILEEAQDIIVVGEAENGVEAQKLVGKLRPDILLLDLVMPGIRPFEVEKWVRSNYPETVTLVLTSHDRDCYLAKAVEAGAVGFLIKEESSQRLLEAIHRAARGQVLFTVEQLARTNQWRKEVNERWVKLTKRERQILGLVIEGQNNPQIAETLCISEHTVRTHVGNTLGKLDINSRAEAIVWAWQHGIVEMIK